MTLENNANYFVGKDGVAVHNCASRTKHGNKRKQEAKRDPYREVRDANRVIREGKHYLDTETGYDVYVSGDRVVIVNPDGRIHTQFVNTRANTGKRISK